MGRRSKSSETSTERFSVRTWPELAGKIRRWLDANPGVSLNQMTCMALDEFASREHVLRPAVGDGRESASAALDDVLGRLPAAGGLSLSKGDVAAIAKAVAAAVSSGASGRGGGGRRR